MTSPVTPVKLNFNASHSYNNSSSDDSTSLLFSPWRTSSDRSNSSPIERLAPLSEQRKEQAAGNNDNHLHAYAHAHEGFSGHTAIGNDPYYIATGPLDFDLSGSVSDSLPESPTMQQARSDSWSFHLPPSKEFVEMAEKPQANGYVLHEDAIVAQSKVGDDFDAHRAQLEHMRNNAQESFDSWLTSTRQSRSLPDKNEQLVEVKEQQHARQLASSAVQTFPSAVHNTFTPFSNHLDWAASNGVTHTNTVSQHPRYSSSETVLPSVLNSIATQFPANDVAELEFSLFVGDLCPDLQEDDLLRQFQRPPSWPPAHPMAMAHAHVQHAHSGMYDGFPMFGPAPFQTVKSATIMTDPLTGASRGFGFVRFSSEKDCARALIEMQGVVIEPLSGRGGRPLRVCPATPKNRSSLGASAGLSASNLLLQEKLSNAINMEQQRGSTIDADLLAKLSVQALTSATASIKTSKPANDAINNALNTSGALDPTNTTVFVGGLSSLISEDTLKTFFVPFGEIRYVKIPSGKGCGFVQFANKQDAERAIERMQGFPIGGGRIRLSWGRSQGDKAAVQAAQSAQHAVQLSHLNGIGPVHSTMNDFANQRTPHGPMTAFGITGLGDGRSYFESPLGLPSPSINAFQAYQNGQYHSQSVPTSAQKATFPSRAGLPTPTFQDSFLGSPSKVNVRRQIDGGLARSYSEHVLGKADENFDLADHFSRLAMSSRPSFTTGSRDDELTVDVRTAFRNPESVTPSLFSSSTFARGSTAAGHSGQFNTTSTTSTQTLSTPYNSFDPFAQPLSSPPTTLGRSLNKGWGLGETVYKDVDIRHDAISPPNMANSPFRPSNSEPNVKFHTNN